ncbi:MAG: addiction module protein [Gemmatimonadetes bacterium]|nr:addiction module protein [Gemmatimonadota bacterium]
MCCPGDHFQNGPDDHVGEFVELANGVARRAVSSQRRTASVDALPPEERADVAAELLASLDETDASVGDVQAEWAAEIPRDLPASARDDPGSRHRARPT